MTTNLPAKIQHPLDPTLKQSWLHALRGGQYAQGRRSYRTFTQRGGDRYDPLGVLADVMYPDEWETLHQIHFFGNDKFKFKNMYIHNIPKVIFAADLSEPTVQLLCRMNDEGKSFQTIADWIEGNL